MWYDQAFPVRDRTRICWSGGGFRSEQRFTATYLEHSHLLTIAQQSEGEGVLGVQPGDDLTAPQWQRGHVALQVGPVLVQKQLVVLQPAPALTPAVVGQDVQVTCQSPGRSATSYSDLFGPLAAING